MIGRLERWILKKSVDVPVCCAVCRYCGIGKYEDANFRYYWCSLKSDPPNDIPVWGIGFMRPKWCPLKTEQTKPCGAWEGPMVTARMIYPSGESKGEDEA